MQSANEDASAAIILMANQRVRGCFCNEMRCINLRITYLLTTATGKTHVPRRPINSRYSRRNCLGIDQCPIRYGFCRRLVVAGFRLVKCCFTRDRRFPSTAIVNGNRLVWYRLNSVDVENWKQLSRFIKFERHVVCRFFTIIIRDYVFVSLRREPPNDDTVLFGLQWLIWAWDFTDASSASRLRIAVLASRYLTM